MKQANFKKMVHWLGLVLMFLAIAALFKALFLQGLIVQSLEHEDGMAFTITLVYALFFPTVLCLSYGLHIGRESETRRLTVKQMNEADFDKKAFWQGEIKENLLRTDIYLALQLPMLLFCTIFEYSFDYQIFLESFYAGTAGFYIMTPVPLIGWVLSGVYLFGLLMLTRFVQLKIWQKDSAVG